MTEKNTAKLKEYARAVERHLTLPVAEQCALQRSVIDAMNYSLSAGGKRIRPVLVMEFCRVCGGKVSEDTEKVAAAIEMIHTFSLIHDDLPCMDDDDLRRGKPSCHKAFGEATALLAGDALAIYPFEVIANTDFPADIRVRLMAEIASAVGAGGMIGGQIIDMEHEDKPVDEALLRRLCACKTGALIRAAGRMGCICGGGTAGQLAAADIYTEKIGLAFQIVDDILDIIGDEKTLGKPIGSDAEQHKNTFATLLGLKAAQELAEKLTSEAIEALSVFEDREFLTELALMLSSRRK